MKNYIDRSELDFDAPSYSSKSALKAKGKAGSTVIVASYTPSPDEDDGDRADVASATRLVFIIGPRNGSRDPGAVCSTDKPGRDLDAVEWNYEPTRPVDDILD